MPTRRRIGLGATIILNVVLIAAIARLSVPASQTTPARASSGASAAPGSRTAVTTRLETAPRYPDTAAAADQRRWVIDQLRAMGIPNRVLARVALLDLEESSEARGEEVAKRCQHDPAAMAEWQLETEKNRDAEMRAALGEDGFRQWDYENMRREIDGGGVPLTAAESDTAYALWKQLKQHEFVLKEAKLKGTMDDAQANDLLDRTSADYERQMKALLGEERYAKAQQIDAGTAAESLRREFASANPSEAQFGELLQAQQQWNERRAEMEKQLQSGEAFPNYEAQVRALDEARDQEYRRVLGRETFDALQKEQDPGYARMKKFAEAWALDDSKIDYVYGTLKYYEKTVQDYQARARAREAEGQGVDWTAINRNLRTFADQTQQALQSSLGPDAYAKLQRNGVIQLKQIQLPGGRPF